MQKRGVTSTDSALACDEQIMENLRGCDFPNEALNKLDGGTFKIEELKGNVVFVHFWFVNCATCIAEMPAINRLHDAYAGQPVQFLAISFDSREKLGNFFKKGKTMKAIQTYLDQKTLESTFCILNTYPVNIVLDKNGRVIDAWTEENPEADKQEEFYEKVKTEINKGLK